MLETTHAKPPPWIEPTDGELLFRFVGDRSEEAFHRLVDRHARLVASVCRRVLWHEQDVEDAFQATFLVLVRRADRLRRRDSVAAWLFQVARRISLRASDRRRRNATTEDDVESAAAGGTPLDRLQDREEFEILAAELDRLPESYRLPLVLHYLEGRSRAETAEQLDCTESAVKARLARGRRLLRRRLMRRGVALSVAFAALTVPTTTQAGLVTATTSAAVHHATGGAAGLAAAPGPLTLAQGLPTMLALPAAKTLAVVGTTLAASLLVAVGVALSQPPESSTNSSPAGPDLSVDAAADPSSPTEPSAAGRGIDMEVSSDTEVTDAEENTVSDDPVESNTPRKPKSVAHLLNEPVTTDFNDERLSEILDEFRRETGLNTVIDGELEQEAGWHQGHITSRRTRSVSFEGTPLRKALEMILRQHSLKFHIDGDHVVITPSDAALRAARDRRGPSLDLKALRPNEQRIVRALDDQTDMAFVDVPLSEAIEYFGDLHAIPMVIDETALDDEGIPLDEPINRVISGISLDSGLNLVLDPIGLTYVIEDEVMKITSQTKANGNLEFRVYAIGPLLDAGVLETDAVEELLLQQAEGKVVVAGDFVTIHQSQPAHRSTRELLGQLHRAATLGENATTKLGRTAEN